VVVSCNVLACGRNYHFLPRVLFNAIGCVCGVCGRLRQELRQITRPLISAEHANRSLIRSLIRDCFCHGVASDHDFFDYLNGEKDLDDDVINELWMRLRLDFGHFSEQQTENSLQDRMQIF
jgi:hypothetical protein